MKCKDYIMCINTIPMYCITQSNSIAKKKNAWMTIKDTSTSLDTEILPLKLHSRDSQLQCYIYIKVNSVIAFHSELYCRSLQYWLLWMPLLSVVLEIAMESRDTQQVSPQ